ncbi:MAG: molecular chaperone DnaK, partial [Coriobacteriia bacterium]|nr:molecular chaperone DnaK [Coriobacteriia bacterium]
VETKTVATGSVEPRYEVEIKPQISGIISELRKDKAKKALEGTDIEAIKAAGEELKQTGYKLAEIVYSSANDQAGAAGAAGANAGSAPADDVVDADYEVVDDKDPKKEN